MDHIFYGKLGGSYEFKNQIEVIVVSEEKLRILGKGLTAQAVKNVYPNALMYDDENKDEFDIDSNELTVVSPGIPPSNYLVQNTKNLISDYDLFLNHKKVPFSIWISGTNGKTTTTQMCQHLLGEYKSEFGGNIGTPLAALNRNSKIWILESSSFTLHYTNKASPNLYVLLPISEDHISWHGSFDEYKRSKLKPMDNMSDGEVAIIPKEFEDYETRAKKIVYESSEDLCQIFNIDRKKIKFKEPFLLDSVLALGCSKILFDEINYDLINSFTIDKHKVEEFVDSKKRLWVDDSKATNIDATICALESYKAQKIYLILGGDDKGANLEPLFEKLKSFNVEIFSIGSNNNKIIQLSSKFNLTCNSCDILDNAVTQIGAKHGMDTVVLLSPAASSLDQFSSYKQRGERFKELVHRLS